ncbi:MAG TPA: hypothetical protein VNA25_09535 [Phycisphaerae bacterium]|nr:hypothetical protein [Phycisphaerae bacterium]
MSWFKGRKTSGFVALRSTIRPGEAMRIGDVQVEVTGGNILVACGRRAALIVIPDFSEGLATVQCYSDGQALPEKVLIKVPDLPQAPDPPLVRLGPGGDYVQNWPSSKALRHAAQRARRSLNNVQPAGT